MEESQGLNENTRTTPKAFSERNPHCNLLLNPSENSYKSYQETCDLTSNAVLNYIGQMLLEEEMDEKAISCQNEVALRVTEKSFYEILGQDYPPSFDGSLVHDAQYLKNSAECINGESSSEFVNEPLENDPGHDVPSWKHPLGSDDPIPTMPLERILAWQIQKGAEESMKFLPNIDKLSIDLETNRFELTKDKEEAGLSTNKKEGSNNHRSKKKTNHGDFDILEGRCQKQIFVHSDEPDENEISDKVLLLFGRNSIKDASTVRETLKKEMRDKQNEAKGSKRTVEQDNNQIGKGAVDLRSLLVHCSEAVSANDRTTATELIKKIKVYSSPNGDSFQRLAYYFVDALGARLAGAGSETYRKFVSKKPTLSDILKAFRLFMATCPCERSIFYFANQTIFNIAKDATKVHIINYGIMHGFQWPSFFERFSNRKSTPPKIRITIIEVPEPGFRPNKQIEAIGRRLAFFARRFNVPFEYQGIASKWEDIKPEDLNISKDEVVIVSCLEKSDVLSDEIVASSTPRDNFLKTIRKIEPWVFIHGSTNGSYNFPFFLARFRSVLSHYSCLFDMLDSNLPRDNPERELIERGLIIPKAINAIACEGLERVARPETYKQWQARHHRAGLVQIPVDSMIMKNMKDFTREFHHKDFVIDEDNGWVLLGWKGRILYAMSTWKSNKM